MWKSFVLVPTFLLALQASPAMAGGGTGSGAVNVIVRGIVDPYVSGAKAGTKAVYYGAKYAFRSWGEDDIVHRDMAYMWGYDSALSPETAAKTRSATEYAQGFYFTLENGVRELTPLKEGKYVPTEVYTEGGGLDTIGDINETRQGASDREQGLPPNPPSKRLTE